MVVYFCRSWLKKGNPRKRIGVATHLMHYYRIRGGVSEALCPGGLPVADPV